MRKDLKIGLAIGAVLLVVLIVYLAVPKSDDQLAQNPAGGNDTAATEPGASSSTPSATSREEPAAPAPKPEPAQAEAGKGATPEAPKDEHGATAEKPSKGPDPFAVWADALDGGKLPVISQTPTLSAAGGPTNPATGAAAPAAAPKATEPPVVAPPTPAAGSETTVSKPEAKSAKPDKLEAKPAAAAPDTGDTASATAGRPHKIRAGETYSSIAKLIYGDARYYLAIQKANPDIDPAKLKPGTEIKLPDIESVKGAAHPAGEKQKAESPSSASGKQKQLDAATEYRVQSGDSLHRIAMKRYGSSTMADKIYEINKATIGDDSAKLKPGMLLKMPPNPNAGESQISSTR